jgi:phosphoribosylanthranilate isomerase
MVNIKVSGITDVKQLKQLDGLGIDFAGLFFSKNSPACIVGKLKPEDVKNVDLDIKKVGVFSDAEMIEVLDAIEDYGLDAVELRGNETPKMCEDLSSAIEVIRVFKITKDTVDVDEMVQPFDDACDYYLFEVEGHSFDWSIFKKSRIEKPFFLSGVGPADIKKIKAFNHPDFFGVDIDEQFEKESGVKDMVSILQFKQGLRK